jgi:hypothetical protein
MKFLQLHPKNEFHLDCEILCLMFGEGGIVSA